MNNQDTRIEHLIQNGYAMNVSQYISRGLALIQNQMVFFVFSNVVTLIGAIAGQFTGGLLQNLFGVGQLAACREIALGNEVRFEDFFKPFQNSTNLVSNIVNTLIMGLIMLLSIMIFAVPMVIAAIPFIEASTTEEPDLPITSILLIGVFSLLLFLFVIYLGVSYILMPALVHFRNRPIWHALEESRKIVGRNFFGFFGLGILIGLLNVVGMLFFVIGLLFTVPLTYAILYVVYEDVVGFDDDEELGIEEHFVL